MAVTCTEQITAPFTGRLKYVWVSDTDGGATGASTSGINAYILGVEFVPSDSDAQPSDLYDATLTDAEGVDLLLGQGANLSNANTIALTANLFPCPGDKLTLTVSNAGEVNGGTVYVYLGTV